MIADRIATLKSRLSGGVTPAMATPLVPGTYRVNLAVVPALVDFLLAAGVKGLFVGGTTGEGILLDDDERRKLHEAVAGAAAGRAPVLVHVGAQRTETAAALAAHAVAIKADAVVAVTPYFYGLNDDALARYFHGIAAAAPELPLFLYDIPQFAANSIGPALPARLGGEIPSLAGIKTSRVDVQAVRQLIDALPERLILLAGNESAALGLLALGADGLISGLSTAVPEPFVALTAAYAAGDLTTARRRQQTVNRLLGLLTAGARLGGIKGVLNERGIPVGPPAPTLAPAPGPLWPRMKEILDNEGIPLA